jgi:type IV pilus assembly protein PilM
MSIFSKLTGPPPIGLDIGSSAIKVVQLVAGRQGIILSKAGSVPTPPEAVKGGVVVDHLAVAQAIRSLLSALQIEATAAVGGVAGPTVVVRQVQLPSMSERQLRKSISWEARNYISFPVEDSVLECQVVDGTGSQMDVMLVAAPRDMVDSQVETIELAGLEPVAVEIQPFAVMRSLCGGNGKSDGPETVALMGIGAAYTDITIVKDGGFVLSRIIPIASNGFTETIRSALDTDMEQANQLKETAMKVVVSEEERATLDPAAQQASRAVEPLLDELVREVRRSLAYHDFQQKLPESAAAVGVNRIILSGGGAKLDNISTYLQAQLGIPVTLAELFGEGRLQTRGMNPEFLRKYAPTLVVGVGLALRELMPSVRRTRK